TSVTGMSTSSSLASTFVPPSGRCFREMERACPRKLIGAAMRKSRAGFDADGEAKAVPRATSTPQPANAPGNKVVVVVTVQHVGERDAGAARSLAPRTRRILGSDGVLARTRPGGASPDARRADRDALRPVRRVDRRPRGARRVVALAGHGPPHAHRGDRLDGPDARDPRTRHRPRVRPGRPGGGVHAVPGMADRGPGGAVRVDPG